MRLQGTQIDRGKKERVRNRQRLNQLWKLLTSVYWHLLTLCIIQLTLQHKGGGLQHLQLVFVSLRGHIVTSHWLSQVLTVLNKCLHLTRLWQDFDKTLTRLWQDFDKTTRTTEEAFLWLFLVSLRSAFSAPLTTSLKLSKTLAANRDLNAFGLYGISGFLALSKVYRRSVGVRHCVCKECEFRVHSAASSNADHSQSKRL